MTTMQTCLRPVLALHLTRIREAGPLQKALQLLASSDQDPSEDECRFHARAMEATQVGQPLVAACRAGRVLTGEGWRRTAFPSGTGHGQVLNVAPDAAEAFVHIKPQMIDCGEVSEHAY